MEKERRSRHLPVSHYSMRNRKTRHAMYWRRVWTQPSSYCMYTLALVTDTMPAMADPMVKSCTLLNLQSSQWHCLSIWCRDKTMARSIHRWRGTFLVHSSAEECFHRRLTDQQQWRRCKHSENNLHWTKDCVCSLRPCTSRPRRKGEDHYLSKFFLLVRRSLTVNNGLFSRLTTRRNKGSPAVVPTSCETFVTWHSVSVWVKTMVKPLRNWTSNDSATPPRRDDVQWTEPMIRVDKWFTWIGPSDVKDYLALFWEIVATTCRC